MSAPEHTRRNVASGYIHLIIGPMYSGKTSMMGTFMERQHRANRRCVIIKHTDDTRYDKLSINGGVVSHCGVEYGGVNITTIKTSKLGTIDVTEYDVIGIDEGQFFPDLVKTANKWASTQKIVACAYLDARADGKQFADLGGIVASAEVVIKLTSICHYCQNDASFSHHIAGDIGKSGVKVGGVGEYVAVCRDCFNEHYIKKETK